MSDIHFFYGGPLSQWYPCTFTVDGIEYNCAEQYMMAQKAKLFGDEETYMKIMHSNHPREQKSLGRIVKGFDLKIWNDKAPRIVIDGNFHKFSQNEDLKKVLLGTGDKELVEASATDTIWGIGLGMDDDRRFDRTQWRGTNFLGLCLVIARYCIRLDKNNNYELGK